MNKQREIKKKIIDSFHEGRLAIAIGNLLGELRSYKISKIKSCVRTVRCSRAPRPSPHITKCIPSPPYIHVEQIKLRRGALFSAEARVFFVSPSCELKFWHAWIILHIYIYVYILLFGQCNNLWLLIKPIACSAVVCSSA